MFSRSACSESKTTKVWYVLSPVKYSASCTGNDWEKSQAEKTQKLQAWMQTYLSASAKEFRSFKKWDKDLSAAPQFVGWYNVLVGNLTFCLLHRIQNVWKHCHLLHACLSFRLAEKWRFWGPNSSLRPNPAGNKMKQAQISQTSQTSFGSTSHTQLGYWPNACRAIVKWKSSVMWNLPCQISIPISRQMCSKV